MKIRTTLLAASLLSLATVPAAHAGAKVLASAPGVAYYPALQTISCNILSLNDASSTITIDVMDYSGMVVATSGALSVPPQNTASFADGSGNGAWCRFTVDNSTKRYRAVAVYDNGVHYTTANPAN